MEGIKAFVHQFKVGKTRSENKNNTCVLSFQDFREHERKDSSQPPVKIKAVDNKCRANIACSCRGRYPNPEIIQEKTFLYNFEAAALLKASFVSLLVLRDRRSKLPSRRHHDKFPLYIIQSEEKELCAEIS